MSTVTPMPTATVSMDAIRTEAALEVHADTVRTLITVSVKSAEWLQCAQGASFIALSEALEMVTDPETRDALGYWIVQAEQRDTDGRDSSTIDWVNGQPDAAPQPAVPALGSLVQTGAAAQVKLSEMVGAIKGFRVQEEFSRVARTKMLAEIKESEAYKGLKIIGHEGSVVECKRWEDFVASLNIGSVATVDEQIRFLDSFGERFMEAANSMKVGYRDLRRLKQLPAEDRQAVVAEVEQNLGDKDAVLALIDGMADKHARENRDSADRISKLEKDLEKKTRQVDAIVKAETEALESERDALLERTNELETQLGGGDWDKTREAAQRIADQVQVLRNSMNTLQRVMPTDKPLPTDLAAEIGAAIFHARDLAQGVWDAWEDRMHPGSEA